jgi:hypothetical protein
MSMLPDRPDERTTDDRPGDDAPAEPRATTPAKHEEDHLPPHPPGARTPDEYMDRPGHHRRGRNGPALDVGG